MFNMCQHVCGAQCEYGVNKRHTTLLRSICKGVSGVCAWTVRTPPRSHSFSLVTKISRCKQFKKLVCQLQKASASHAHAGNKIKTTTKATVIKQTFTILLSVGPCSFFRCFWLCFWKRESSSRIKRAQFFLLTFFTHFFSFRLTLNTFKAICKRNAPTRYISAFSFVLLYYVALKSMPISKCWLKKCVKLATNKRATHIAAKAASENKYVHWFRKKITHTCLCA